jgi:N-glycosylase/DNA lyase
MSHKQVDLSRLAPFKLAECSVLNLDICLGSGQTFSWIQYKDYWLNVFGEKVLILSTKDDSVYFWTEPEQEAATRCILSNYFRLDIDLSVLYKEWSQRDAHFAKLCHQCPGVRLLDQPAFESLLSFICSQNNGISRITSMVRTLKEKYGRPHAVIDGTVTVYTFPCPADLTHVRITQELVENGFGYRARYIQAVSCRATDGNLDLELLRTAPREQAWSELLKIVGVGPKVADCVALTGLGQFSSVPVDTHIWKVARTFYTGMPSGKSLTLRVYTAIGDRFRMIFGPHAGWAHLVLFAAQIKEKTRKIK